MGQQHSEGKVRHVNVLTVLLLDGPQALCQQRPHLDKDYMYDPAGNERSPLWRE